MSWVALLSTTTWALEHCSHFSTLWYLRQLRHLRILDSADFKKLIFREILNECTFLFFFTEAVFLKFRPMLFETRRTRRRNLPHPLEALDIRSSTNMGIDIIKHNENRFIWKLLKIKLRNSNVDHAPVNYAKGICSIKGVKGTFI